MTLDVLHPHFLHRATLVGAVVSLHSTTSEVMQFVTQTKTADPSLSLKQLARAVEEKFDIVVHPRSITRQWQRQKKTP